MQLRVDKLSVIDNFSRVPIIKIGITPSKQTCKKYIALVANENDVSICTSVMSKTRKRYTAEFFLISAMVLICVISATHFDISTKLQKKVENDMKVADEGVSLLHKLVYNLYNNLHILPVKLEIMFSTDDTVNYIYDGQGNDNDEFQLVASKSISKAGKRSRYTIDESNNLFLFID